MSLRAITWSSPLPPTRSGVADYADELLPHLANLCEVAVVTPPDVQPEVDWREKVAWLPAEAPPQGLELLHLGNNPYHLWVAARLRRWKGVVVLHDTVLHHLLVEEAARVGDWQWFAEELRGAEGTAGQALAWGRQWGFSGPLDPFLFPARPAYLRHARGVVVHSQAALTAVRSEFPHLPVHKVPLAVAAWEGGDGVGFRKSLGLTEDEILAVHLGFLTPAKGLDVILRAFAILQELEVPVRLLVVGEGSETEKLVNAVADLGLAGRVVFTGYVTRAQLAAILAAADVGLVPRFPTAGETSAAVLRFLACGKPVVVCGYQQFLEFPPEVALRINPGGEGAVDLARWLCYLHRSREVLAEKRHQARKYWYQEDHAPNRAARRLLQALEDIAETLAQRDDGQGSETRVV